MGRAGRPPLTPNVPRAARFAGATLLVVALCRAVLGIDARAQPPDVSAEQQALLEANKVLQEEIALAARQQTYAVVDVTRGLLLLKSRGVELHRLPVLAWRASEDRPPVGLFRLTTRPPVDRPKASPGEDATEHPIEVGDMPAEYHLALEPALTVAVVPPIEDHPWLWLRSFLREGWARAVAGARAVGATEAKAPAQWLRLTLSPDSARSLAWSVTEGMPLLIGRATLPEKADKSQATK